MRSTFASVGLAALIAFPVGIGVTPAAAATCTRLSGLVLPDTTITAAQPTPAGTYTAPNGAVFTNLPAFCRVAATLTPTSDSNIKIEVWMPYSGWNGKFFGTGNGSIGGIIQYGYLGFFLTLNYAVANTDMGTTPARTDPLGSRVLTGHPEKQIDFATRSTNLMTVRSKQIIRAFYGERPNYSYFWGCSTGGGQAIHEALQFPGDYDGIMAQSPAINRTHDGAANIWNYQAFQAFKDKDPATIAAQARAITSAVVKECAGKDGGLSSDNFLTDPRECRWDPAALQCTGSAADAATCLTAKQVAAMRKFYEGPTNPRTGERIYAGRTRGSESNNGYPAAAPTSDRNAYWVFGNDFDDFLTFKFDRDMDTIDREMAARLNANTADLEEFKSHGGKLLLFHGFADPVIPTLNTVAYYERLIAGLIPGKGHGEGERKVGLRRTQEFARLFLAPGVAHGGLCDGGAGPDSFFLNGLDALVQWVEQDVAPEQIIASKIVNGVTTFTRPLCPYPALPRYSGVGDSTKASSFECATDRDRHDNQPPAPRYLDDGDNYPIVPLDDDRRDHDRRDHDGRDRDKR